MNKAQFVYCILVLHVNLLWRNLIGSLSRDIGQYPMIEISNSGYCFHRKMSRFVCYLKQINPRKKVLSCLFLECSGVVYTKKIIHLLNE